MKSARSGVRLATIRGVELNLHPSLLILLAYVILVASVRFPLVVSQSGLDPGTISGSPLAWGIIFALALLVSVVLHEFGHVLMAQRLGVKVREVTLMMLGGVSQMERIPEERLGEFKVSIVGPLVSFAIAGALYFMRSQVELPELVLFSYWLGSVNLALGIFNLVPAFPLDGGRALRSLLSVRQGRLKGTERAVSIAKVFAIGFGVIALLGFNFLLAFIAIFVYAAASQELVRMRSETLLKDLKVADATIRVEPLAESLSVDESIARMIEARASSLPVENTVGRPAIVTLDQLAKVPRSRRPFVRVAEISRPVSRFLDSQEPLERAFTLLSTENALPVVEGERIVGILRYRDLMEMAELRGAAGELRSDRDREGPKAA